MHIKIHLIFKMNSLVNRHNEMWNIKNLKAPQSHNLLDHLLWKPIYVSSEWVENNSHKIFGSLVPLFYLHIYQNLSFILFFVFFWLYEFSVSKSYAWDTFKWESGEYLCRIRVIILELLGFTYSIPLNGLSIQHITLWEKAQ